MTAEAAHRGEVDMSLVSVDSTTARAHHDPAGIHLDEDVLTARERAAAQEEKARGKKGPRRRDRTGDLSDVTPSAKRGAASGADADSG